MKYLVDTNNKVTNELKQDNDKLKKKLNRHDSDLDEIKTLLKKVLVPNQNLLPYTMDSPKSQYPTTAVPYNSKAPPLEGGNSTKIGGVWTLKHKISSPKFYELLIKTELKGDTDLYLKNFYNHINMCLNAVTRLREDILKAYHSIKIYSEFEK